MIPTFSAFKFPLEFIRKGLHCPSMEMVEEGQSGSLIEEVPVKRTLDPNCSTIAGNASVGIGHERGKR